MKFSLKRTKDDPNQLLEAGPGPHAKPVCPYCDQEFVPWILPASGQYAKSCPFCSIIALHLFNKTPMPQWLSDYRSSRPSLSAREYTLAVEHIQKLLAQ